MKSEQEGSQDWPSDTGFSGHLPQGYKAPQGPCFLLYQALGPPQFSGLCSLNFFLYGRLYSKANLCQTETALSV